MLNKIRNEIDTFTSNIKDIESCDKMLTYANSNIYASIKLLIFASSTFSIYARVMMFFIIAFTGLFVFSLIEAIALNTMTLISITLFLFVLILMYVIYFKNYLLVSINNSKSPMEKSE